MDNVQNTGTVVVGLGCLITIVLPILKLNGSIVELTVEMRNMRERDVTRDKRIEKHGKEIDEIRETVSDHKHKLSNHETRLKTLERK